MPRQARLDAPGTLHHIMIRGIEGQKIFKEDEDKKEFILRLGKTVDKNGDKILAWVLMDNHVHLLVFSGQNGISKLMRCLLTGYAIWYNRKYKRKGHLFQNRYKSIICEEDTYLLELIRYIHLNPVRTGVISNIEELDKYPWSGHSVLVGRVKNEWQEISYVLEQFNKRKNIAIKAYREFMEEGKKLGKRPGLAGGGLVRSLGGWSQVLSLRSAGQKEAYDERILGGGDFVTKIIDESDKKLKRQLRINEKRRIMDQTIKQVCKEEKIKEGELINGGRGKKISGIRAKISYYLNKEIGLSKAEIARELGVCTTAIVKAIQKQESEERR